jgi:5-methylcytosine-specific restriction endonuclease McrA
MIDYALGEWHAEADRDPYDRAILERDGWRCAMPGCTAYGNLHVHHVIYRSRGGREIPWNEIALCVWHHQRGQHGGILRVTGWAPDRLRFEMPLETFRSGDLRVSPQP